MGGASMAGRFNSAAIDERGYFIPWQMGMLSS